MVWTVLLKPGVMDPVALSLADAIRDMGLPVPKIRIGRLYLVSGPLAPLIFYAVNGYLLGREYFELVAATCEELADSESAPRRMVGSPPV